MTAEFKINLVAPGQGECLVSKAKVVKNGQTLKICQAEVFNKKGHEESLCAIALVTLMELPYRPDQKKQV